MIDIACLLPVFVQLGHYYGEIGPSLIVCLSDLKVPQNPVTEVRDMEKNDDSTFHVLHICGALAGTQRPQVHVPFRIIGKYDFGVFYIQQYRRYFSVSIFSDVINEAQAGSESGIFTSSH